MEKTLFVKIHRSYRNVVAVCDSDILGKRFEEGKRQLDVRENFYKGDEMDLQRAIDLIKMQKMEDATFNIVGSSSVKAAIEAGIIGEESVAEVDCVPFALVLL